MTTNRRFWIVCAVIFGTGFGWLGCGGSPAAPVSHTEPVVYDRPQQVEQMALRANPADTVALKAALQDSDMQVRLAAIRGLHQSQPPALLESLLMLAMQPPAELDPRVSTAADQAANAYPDWQVDVARLRLDPLYRQPLLEQRQRRDARDIVSLRRQARQEPPLSRDELLTKRYQIERDRALEIVSVTLKRDHGPIGHPLGYNGRANRGELCEYDITVRNDGSQPRLSSSMYAYTFDPHITILNRELPFPVMQPGETATLSTTMLILVAESIPERHDAEVFLEIGDSNIDGERTPVYRSVSIEIVSIGLGPVRFEASTIDDDPWGLSEGNENGVANWGERVEFTLSVFNDGTEPLTDVTLQVTSYSRLGRAMTTAGRPGNVPSGGRPGFSRIFDLMLAEGRSGPYDVELSALMLKLEVEPSGSQEPDLERVFSWTQTLLLHIEGDSVSVVGPARMYEPFDVAELIDVFVIHGDERDYHEFYLENLAIDYLDYRETMASEYHYLVDDVGTE